MARLLYEGARAKCPCCARPQTNEHELVEAEEAWWEGEDLHLVYPDGRKEVVSDARAQGFVVE